MTFPATPLGLVVELFIDGAWEDITDLVYMRDQLKIVRGSRSEGGELERSSCSFQVNNRDGRFSPRNPTGTWYGLIGRNTPVRVRLTTGPDRYLLMPAPFSEATTPDTAALSITGDIDIRVDWQRDDWTKAAGLASKYVTTGDQRSWALGLNDDQTLTLYWSSAGTLATRITATSTAAVTIPSSGRLAMRATLDVDNGSGGKTVTFYTAPTMAGPWTQLGAAVTTAGTTSIFDSTAPVALGWIAGISGQDTPVGRCYGFQLYAGLAGSDLRADVGLGDAVAGESTFTDQEGVPWTLDDADGESPAAIVTPDVRFVGEVSEWPQRWDTTGSDVWVPVEAAGILRRLGTGTSPLKSTLYRGLTTLDNPPKAYWPCEDEEGATQLASGVGGPPMILTGGAELASHDEFDCSAPIPVTTAAGQWNGEVPVYTASGEALVWWLMKIPAAGAVNGQTIMSVHTTGTVRQWNVIWTTGGNLGLQGLDGAGAQVLFQSFAFGIDGDNVRFVLELTQDGADIDWGISALAPGSVIPGGGGGTLASHTFGRVSRVIVNPGGGQPGIAVGHIAVHDEVLSLVALADQLGAYVGEPAGERIRRLCSEEGIAFRAHGDLAKTRPMGAQLQAELLTLLADASAADGGILFEPRDLGGLAYRPLAPWPGAALARQRPRLELTYDSAHLSAIEPVDDDQQTRNDVTVKRKGGSSARSVADSGPLSVQAPPDGVGRYEVSVTLNLFEDAQLDDAAGWLRHLGTVDEARYPVIGLDLARPVFVASSTLSRAVEDLDVGDRLTIANPPAWLPPDDISQLVLGSTETLAAFTKRIELVCAPESPYGQAAIYDDNVSRYTSDGSTLAEDLTSGQTAIAVATPAGPLWSDADGDFDIVIGGEVMTVTAIAGSSSPQTFTVTRAVNGVSKTHAAGAAVELAPARVYLP